ncbi:phage tail protein [Pseudomonas gingeri NCPPB 3146 = LMG 5327]|uniref:Tail assembly protein n=2 Tax=Pseudomonas gingeri TaxID=117681 RepID=A0A7Y8CEB7_9PSED|nr:tail assembly protein [Pseudomonas gingeri]NWC14876.1 tail assembly protein [Pseudomonas gingeri]PNQ91039.1 phage tail protein [Pseudomonas gingeri NCPPB 3146 = LMG 5327]
MAFSVVDEKVQTVLLSGSLARLFGRKHRVATNGGFRDIMGYFKQFPGFEKFMVESSGKGLRFAVFNGKENISQDDLKKPTGREIIRIVPVIAGSKRAGLLQTIVGVVLIVASYFTGPAAPALFSAGVSMIAGGVLQMLSPQAKGLGTQDRPENRASYSFNGPVNTSAQGNPVGLLYGQMIVGSSVISAGIYTQDQL